MLILLLIIFCFLIIASLGGSRAPALQGLPLCCCSRHVMIPESKMHVRFPLGVAACFYFGAKSVSPLTNAVTLQRVFTASITCFYSVMAPFFLSESCCPLLGNSYRLYVSAHCVRQEEKLKTFQSSLFSHLSEAKK